MTIANLNDRRVRERCVRVHQWCRLMLHPERATELHNKKLATVFGNRGNRTSDQLRDLLLIKTEQRYKAQRSCGPGEKAQSYSYLLNAEGMTVLKHQMDALSLPELVDTIKAAPISDSVPFAEFEDQIESGDFGYTVGERSTRLGHPLQHMKSEQKEPFWSERGYHFNYDIAASGPTLLYQLAMKHGMPKSCLGAIAAYLADRQTFRQHIATVAGINVDDAKDVINALFNGATLAANFHNSIFVKILKSDRQAMARLQADASLSLLRKNIGRMWTKIGAGLKVPVRSAKDKARVYFPLERQVLDAMRDELRDQNARHFCEHDGFVSDVEVDVSLVESRVSQVTGFVIKLSQTRKQKMQFKGGVGCSNGVYKSEADSPLTGELIAKVRQHRVKTMASDVGTKAPDLTLHASNHAISAMQLSSSP